MIFTTEASIETEVDVDISITVSEFYNEMQRDDEAEMIKLIQLGGALGFVMDFDISEEQMENHLKDLLYHISMDPRLVDMLKNQMYNIGI